MNTSVAPSRPKVVPKITRADLGLNIPRLDEKCEAGEDPTKHAEKMKARLEKYSVCYRLGGRVSGCRATKGRGDKDGIQFKGEFEARLSDALGGQRFVSGRAHLPAFFEEMLYARFLSEREADEHATVEFLVDIGAKEPAPGKPSITGYEWTVQPVIEVARQHDPLTALFERASTTPALPGPAGGTSGNGVEPSAAAATGPQTGHTENGTAESHKTRGRAAGTKA